MAASVSMFFSVGLLIADVVLTTLRPSWQDISLKSFSVLAKVRAGAAKVPGGGSSTGGHKTPVPGCVFTVSNARRYEAQRNMPVQARAGDFDSCAGDAVNCNLPVITTK